MSDRGLQFYIIATPIGNLEDITYRAIRVLSEVDTILCEDTRVTRKLLDHYGISTPTESYNAHTNDGKEQGILRGIGEGKTYALVSDAGTPTISDPGVKIIEHIYEEFGNTVDIIPLPGASALISALSVTGFSGNQFTFFGFLPHKKGRNKIFDEIMESSRVSVFYESPHRILKTLESLAELDPKRKIAIARELTKIYEEKVIDSAENVYAYYQEHEDKVRGEFVVIVDKK